MPTLAAADFGDFFEALWGYRPFPWQEDLTTSIVEQRAWPSVVDLPTGAGKTSLLDIAIFLLALDAERDPTDRWMPRRIVNVVDRRVIVDQTYERAHKIAYNLAKASEGPLLVIAESLRNLAGGDLDDQSQPDPPMLVAGLRGAIVRDESWMRRPDVPAVLSSTIDQAGSRLLFRGYGLSRRMRPIHAGLLGNDTLWLLDEVHLARPFAETLRQVGQLRGWRTDSGHEVPARWGVVEMSATPPDGRPRERFPGWPQAGSCIDDSWRFPEHELDASSHETLGRRLRASKPATLHPVKVTTNRASADEKFAQACAKQARNLLAEGPRTIGIIVNRVDTARRAFAELDDSGAETLLLTGRMRAVDRDRLMADYKHRMEMGRARSPVERPLVLVATQSIEAGADLDLDAIVTEAASLDSLRQRFGRVDRNGLLSGADQMATSRVLVRSTDVKDGATDPIYGDALRETWHWLASLDEIDFGIRRLPEPEPAELQRLIAPSTGAPLLLPTHLDQLAQTSVAVRAEPEVARWLHGDEVPSSPDVQVVWRADIDRDLIRSEAAKTDKAGERDPTSAELTERLSACPPASTESLSLPIGAVKAWLEGHGDVAVADVEGLNPPPEERSAKSIRPWVTWADGRATPRDPTSGENAVVRLRPGEVVVVPTSYGGLRAQTWDPSSDEPVKDLATDALVLQGRASVLRVLPLLFSHADDAELPDFPTAVQCDTSSRQDQRRLVREFLEEIPRESLNQAAEVARDQLLTALTRHPTRVAVRWPRSAGWSSVAAREDRSIIVSTPCPRQTVTSVLTGPEQSSQLAATITDGPLSDTDAAEEASSFTGAGASLDHHLQGVGAWAMHLATHLGLSEAIVEDLQLAGELHDLGKHDPRFQLLLHHGDEVAQATRPEPLAKSHGPEPSGERRREIRRASGYPRNARHELTSLPLAEEPLSGARDPDLVAHLVASHHGWCRPFAPPLIDSEPKKVRAGDVVIDSDHQMHRVGAGPPERFARLNQRYGWFTLAWLETLIRLGDHRRSELEQLRQEAGTDG